MRNSVSWQEVVSVAGRRSVTVSLAVAVLLTSTIVATSSAQAQTYKETVLYNFAGGPDGGNPEGGLVMDAEGNLYGSTQLSPHTCCGTVFKLNPTTHKKTNLHTFNAGTDGANPNGPLIWDAKGNLYGTTQLQGAGAGIVFNVNKKTRQKNTLYSFTGGSDGGWSYAGLIWDAEKKNLYGTTSWGGDLSCDPPLGCGTVFKLNPTTGKETVLHAFRGATDGEHSQSPLIMDKEGNLYGTTYSGGTSNGGVVFKVNPATGEETVLHHACSDGRCLDGEYYTSGLILDAKGNLYGTANEDGMYGFGIVFKVNKTTGRFTTLYSFTGGADGANPSQGLNMDANGNLYGTTNWGGTASLGVVFKLNNKGKEAVLHSFTGGTDGGNPQAGVIMDARGNLYGTTFTDDGYAGYGTVYKLTPQ